MEESEENESSFKNLGCKKKEKEEEELKRVNAELALLEDPEGGGYVSMDSRNKIKDLEASRRTILQIREESWRLKSREICLQAGDENTKFFQNYAKGRKMANTIWEIPKGNGDMASSFEDLASLGITYFKDLFKAPAEASIAEVIRVAQLFPRYIEEE